MTSPPPPAPKLRLAPRLVALIVVGAAADFTWRDPNPGVTLPLAGPRDLALAFHTAWQDQLPRREGEYLPMQVEPAFGPLKFWDPLHVTTLPDGSGGIVVVERRGSIQLIEGRGGQWSKTLFADLRDKLRLPPNRAEQGLLGLAFHPKFSDPRSAHRGELFVFYATPTQEGSVNRLSRLRTLTGRLDRVDPASEEILIDQPDREQAHNAGCLEFGPDGMLYAAVGDDDEKDPNIHAQHIDNDLFSGILRLDVDQRGGAVSHVPPRQPRTGKTAGYFIPNDNPFVGRPGVLEEFYAIGFRNPWRFSFDRPTGRMFVADVGNLSREEIDLVVSGSNCQWPYAEGTVVRRDIDPEAPERPAEPLGVETPPLYDYGRDAARRCIIGGHVYRGSQFPELVGRYVFADQSRRIYALDVPADGGRATSKEWLASIKDVGIGVSSISVDGEGELYVTMIMELGTETGYVYKLRKPTLVQRSQLPHTLAATGLFADWRRLQAAADLVPYEVRVPFWSDGADKRRWIGLPDGESPSLVGGGRMEFPAGTTFVKHFEMALDERRPHEKRRLETRVLVCNDEGGVFGGAYRWSADGREAKLVTYFDAEDLAITHADGSTSQQTWQYPGRFDCAMCHNAASGGVLAYTLEQLDCEGAPDGEIDADGVGPTCPEMVSPGTRRIYPTPLAESQLERLVRVGALPPEAVAAAAQLPGPKLARADDLTASIEHRMRSYLDVNCAMCHNPKRQFAAFDARIVRPLAEQGLVDGPSFYHKELGDAARIVAPGNLGTSVLFTRLASTEPSLKMPPLGSSVVDSAAVRLVEQWVASLAPPAKLPTTLQAEQSGTANSTATEPTTEAVVR